MKKRNLSLICAFHLIVWVIFSALNGPNIAKAESGVSMIRAGKGFTVALKHDGTVWSWGVNVRGHLGDGTKNNSYIPRQVGISNVVSIAVNVAHTLTLKDDGTVWSWGTNDYGQLGNGTTWDSEVLDLCQ
jgi:alpha-tubulin suppressor-like RCC1 family protein